MTEEIKEFDKIEVTNTVEPTKKTKDKIESKPKRKYKKDKKKDIPKDIIDNNYNAEMIKIELTDKRKEFLKTLEGRFVNKEFVRYKERIFEIITFKCDVSGKGHVELFNKKFSCTIGLLVENLAEHHFEFDL